MNNPADLEVMTPIESQHFPGFYHYPEEPKLLVSEDGLVINSLNGKLINGHNKINGRKTISFSFKNKVRTRQLHRIVARTFCGRPSRHLNKDWGALEVNHIDLITSNNSKDNLEWVDSGENAKHCHLSGGHTSDTPVLAKDIQKGSVRRFASAKQCADRFGIHRATFFKRLKNGNSQKKKCKGFVFKYDDGTPWLIQDAAEDLPEFGSSGTSGLGPVAVKDSGKWIVFGSVFQASNHYCIPKTMFFRNMRDRGEHIWDGMKIIFLKDLSPETD